MPSATSTVPKVIGMTRIVVSSRGRRISRTRKATGMAAMRLIRVTGTASQSVVAIVS